MSRTGQFTEAEVIPRDRGMTTSKYRLMSMTTNKYDISFWGDENVLNLDTSTGCTTL